MLFGRNKCNGAMLLTHLVLWNRIAVHELPLLVALSNLSVIQEYRDTSVILFLFFFRSNLENCFEFLSTTLEM